MLKLGSCSRLSAQLYCTTTTWTAASQTQHRPLRPGLSGSRSIGPTTSCNCTDWFIRVSLYFLSSFCGEFCPLIRYSVCVCVCVCDQSCGVGGKMVKLQLRPFQNFRLLNINGMKFGCWNRWKSWCTARNFCFNKSSKINCTISTGIPNLGVWYKKWSNCTSGVGVGQKNPTPSVVRNLTPHKNPQLLTTSSPTPQPWLKLLTCDRPAFEDPSCLIYARVPAFCSLANFTESLLARSQASVELKSSMTTALYAIACDESLRTSCADECEAALAYLEACSAEKFEAATRSRKVANSFNHMHMFLRDYRVRCEKSRDLLLGCS